MSWKAKAEKLTRDIPALFLALSKKETPWTAKLLAAATVAYALSPVDLIPDFIPVLGYLDDLLLLPLLAAGAIRLIPKNVMAACREEAFELWKDGKPKRWRYAIPIFLFWLLLLAVAIKIIAGAMG
ncbi:MAG: DUF1232 domain-containing protein [Oscillospiraceae bacterium]|nr:DUF1232 domain-containing protein [Oscillospiraceae bacterium]